MQRCGDRVTHRLGAEQASSVLADVGGAEPVGEHPAHRRLDPVGGVVEDPATGAAAAAFGNYLRETGAVTAPATVTVHQGVDMGRPSLLMIDIDEASRPEIRVSGRAVAM